MKTIPTPMLVVAGAIARPDGQWLMHRRPPGKQHGGSWEFPGGKVEKGEAPIAALLRELREELGIAVRPSAAEPACFAETPYEMQPVPIVIMLYTIRAFTGEPAALEGGEVDWFTHKQIADLRKPPLDVSLAGKLRLLFPQ